MAEPDNKNKRPQDSLTGSEAPADISEPQQRQLQKEIGGPLGPEPTRYGDWERRGRCSDF